MRKQRPESQSNDLVAEIQRWKEKRNAVLLVHNYQPPEIQDIADFLGDSLGLSRQAAQTDASVIVFCGVHFMAETAAILCPDKVVLLPDVGAGCPMADMITAEQLRGLKQQHPDAAVVCYVNTTAAVKAESDVACTSANAVQVVEAIDKEKVIFVPDKSLAHYVSRFTDKEIVAWPGFCPTHHRILPEHIREMRRRHPDAEVVVHPECIPEVVDLADKVFSTSGMVRYAKETTAPALIVGTETGILYRLEKENPQKRFYAATPEALCPNMKKISLQKVLASLQRLEPRVEVPEPIRRRAYETISVMLELQ